MKIRTEAKKPGAAAVGQPLLVLDEAALAQVAGGGPNGGWAVAPAGAPAAAGAADHGAAGGPNGGWAVVTGGPNGGW